MPSCSLCLDSVITRNPTKANWKSIGSNSSLLAYWSSQESDQESVDALIAFDFDMTLVDSNSGVLATITKSFEQKSIEMVDDPTRHFTTLRGLKLREQIERMAAIPLANDQIGDLECIFGLIYPETGVGGTKVFPFVVEILSLLQTKRIDTHIVSAKGNKNLQLSLETLGIWSSAWIGDVSGKEKTEYLRQNGCTTYVGDMAVDVEIARETPCTSIIINNAREDTGTWLALPDFQFSSTQEFYEWIRIPRNLEAL